MQKSQQEEASEYLSKHKITDVLSIMTSSLVYKRPYNTRRYICDYLTKLKESRDSYQSSKEQLVPNGPSHPLFDNEAINALFDTADVLKVGHISYETAVKLGGVLGVSDPEGLFEAFLENGIVFRSEFIRTLRDSLFKSTAHYVDVKRGYTGRSTSVSEEKQQQPDVQGSS